MSEPKCEKLPYVSCITVGGRPILPPVMYPERIVEMRHYKQLAMQKEIELLDRKRERHKRAFNTQENLQTAPSPKKCALPSAIDYPSNINEMSKLQESLSNASSGDDGTDNAVVNSIVNAFNEHLTIHESYKFGFRIKEMSVALSGHDVSKENSMCDDQSQTPSSEFASAAVISKHDMHTEGDVSQNDMNTVVRKMSLASLTDEDDPTVLSDTTVISASQFSQKMPDNRSLTSPGDTPHANCNVSMAAATGSWVATDVDAEDHFTSPGAIVMEGIGHCGASNLLNADSETDTVSIKLMSDTPTMAPSATCSKSVVTDTTPPSLASTNLAKYLHASPDDIPSDPFRPGTSASLSTSICAADLPMDFCCGIMKESYDTNSANSTIKANSECLTEIMGHLGDASMRSPAKRSAEDEEAGGLHHHQQRLKVIEVEKPCSTRVRRSSYTLECPSPALMAHAQLCEEQGISMADDMTSSLRRTSSVSVRDVGGEQCTGKTGCKEVCHQSTDALHLPSEDLDVVNKNKQRHLENYLHNLSSYSEDQEILKSYPVFADNPSSAAMEAAVSDQHTSKVPEMPETPRPPKLESYEDMLRDQSLYIEQLTLRLKEEHKRQMALLMAQQEEDLSSYFHEVKGIEGFKYASRYGSLDDLTSLPATPAAIAKEIEAEPSKVSPQQENFIDNALAIAHKYQLLLHIKSPKVVVPAKASDPSFSIKYNYLSARVKGYLTRRLLRTERVQGIIKTIRDTLEFAVYFHSETPIKTGRVTPAEANLHKRILMQLTSACYDFHDIFFKLSKAEQMAIISHDRVLIRERIAKENDPHNLVKRNLSSATLKALERKKVKSVNNSSHALASNVGGRSKSVASWSSSPKRRKVSLDSIKSAAARPSRPRTTSPRLPSRPASIALKSTDQRLFRNARRNLASIYTPDAKRPPSVGRACRPLRPPSSGASPSFSSSKKSN